MSVTAPFTDEQVRSLQERQDCDLLHPYTCNGCSPARTLVPYTDGLKCLHCHYRQDWVERSDLNFDPERIRSVLFESLGIET